MKNIIISILAVFLISPLNAKDTFESFQVQLENDSVGLHPHRSDRHFTQGLRLSWIYKQDRQPEFLNTIGNKLGKFFKPDFTSSGFAIGQNFFTPNDISDAQLNLNDRPWAGILYGSALFYMPKFSKDGYELSSHQTDFSLGVIGPSSLSEQVQTEWHEIVNAPDPKGWDNQLEDEPVFNINYRYRKKWPSNKQQQKSANDFDWDFNPHAGFSLGTISTGFHGGITARFGKNLRYLTGGLLPFAGVEYIPPSPSTNGAANTPPAAVPNTNNGWNIALGLTGYGVLHNIFLDGNVFRDSIHSVDNETFIYDTRISFNIRNTKLLFWDIGDYEFGLDMVRRSKEFENQTPSSQYFSGFRFKKYFKNN